MIVNTVLIYKIINNNNNTNDYETTWYGGAYLNTSSGGEWRWRHPQSLLAKSLAIND